MDDHEEDFLQLQQCSQMASKWLNGIVYELDVLLDGSQRASVWWNGNLEELDSSQVCSQMASKLLNGKYVLVSVWLTGCSSLKTGSQTVSGWKDGSACEVVVLLASVL